MEAKPERLLGVSAIEHALDGLGEVGDLIGL